MANAPRPGSSSSSADDSATREVERASELLATHLKARGVLIHSRDNPDNLASMMEAVEAFEAAVEERGGDLMVDEAPAGKKVQPDNPEFVLPKRGANESATVFTDRITSATRAISAQAD